MSPDSSWDADADRVKTRNSPYTDTMSVSYGRLVGRPYVRVLRTLQNEGPLRFNQLQRRTGLDPKTIDRILKALIEEHFVYTRALPAEGTRVPAEFRIAPRGKAILDVQRGASRVAERHRDILGDRLADEITSVA